ncbi:hypothetical protein CRE_26709 [Caenorhabditis remanei]|uniref:Uncharacterized protein n=1 Tax=Caenorhabditis remanei TaxID=31234 RepID=E3MXS9_CAERE|nr:hypothetical protein CRE_26709 [Caenorhabditis remanei]
MLDDGDGPRVFRKKTSFPTQEELNFFHANVSIGKEPTMKRQNAAYRAMDPVRIKFINLDKVAFGSDLHYHMSTLFKRNVWFQLEHSGLLEKSGIVRNHLTYNLSDGGVIMNKLADAMQSNKEISIDEGFSVTMNVFRPKKQ